MPDPIVLPYELWNWCIAYAIDGKEAGSLELLAVSRRWERALLNTPSLWSQIYIKNGEDELARIATFLHFSKRHSLHVDIMTALPNLDSLRLLAKHTSRVATISIRPGEADTTSSSQMERWKKTASSILARLSNGLLPFDAKYALCHGVSLWDNKQLYNCIVLMQFALATAVNDTNMDLCTTSAELGELWEEHVKKMTGIPSDQDADTRSNSIVSLAKLASYAQNHSAIRIAIPSCAELLKEHDHTIQSATLDTLQTFTRHADICNTMGSTVPFLVSLLIPKNKNIFPKVVSLLTQLAKHDKNWEVLGVAMPSFIGLLKRKESDVRTTAVSLLAKLAEYSGLCEALRLLIPSVITLFGCRTVEFVLSAISLLQKLTEHGELRLSLGQAIPSLIKLLTSKSSELRQPAVSLLVKLGKYGKLGGALELALPAIMKLLEHKDLDVRFAAVSVLGEIPLYPELCEALRPTIPAFVLLLDYDDWVILKTTVNALERFAEHAELRGELKVAIRPLTKLTRHWHPDTKKAAGSLLKKLNGLDE